MGEKYFQESASNFFMSEKYFQEFASIFFMGEKYFQEFAPIFFMGGPHVGPPTWAPRGPTHLGPGAGRILGSQPDPSPNAPRDQIRRKDPCCDHQPSPLPPCRLQATAAKHRAIHEIENEEKRLVVDIACHC